MVDAGKYPVIGGGPVPVIVYTPVAEYVPALPDDDVLDLLRDDELVEDGAM